MVSLGGRCPARAAILWADCSIETERAIQIGKLGCDGEASADSLSTLLEAHCMYSRRHLSCKGSRRGI